MCLDLRGMVYLQQTDGPTSWDVREEIQELRPGYFIWDLKYENRKEYWEVGAGNKERKLVEYRVLEVKKIKLFKRSRQLNTAMRPSKMRTESWPLGQATLVTFLRVSVGKWAKSSLKLVQEKLRTFEPVGTDNIKSSHCEGKESPGAVAEGVMSRTTADLLPDV